MNDDVIVVENLVKYFDGRCILDGINLNVPKGCIYGLLGRNGAGKTTMIRILLGLEPATRGQTFLLGAESANVPAKVRGRIGSVAEGHNLIQNYRVGRLIKLCKDLSLQWNDEFFGHLIETFRLPTDRRVRELSIGMRAQLNLALAMAIDPELLILDDPTLGLDTIARRQFLGANLEQEGLCIIAVGGRRHLGRRLCCLHLLAQQWVAHSLALSEKGFGHPA